MQDLNLSGRLIWRDYIAAGKNYPQAVIEQKDGRRRSATALEVELWAALERLLAESSSEAAPRHQHQKARRA